MARFANENAYDAIIDAEIAGAPTGVDRALVKAIIGTESGFKPNAYRGEPHIGDASRGLMQILLRTAQGVGFAGPALDLYDPATNIRYGVRFLSGLVRSKGGDVWSAVSAYNNGNGRVAKVTTTVCLARNADGTCARSFTAQPGQFLNQPYVDKVKALYRYFSTQLAGGGALGLLLMVGLVASKMFRA